MQEMLLEGDASYDIDTLNPSLTDLQLQGTKDSRDYMTDGGLESASSLTRSTVTSA